MDLTYSWTITGTLTVFGFGLGLLAAANRSPRHLYIVGTIVALTAGCAYLLEGYFFFLGPAMKTVNGGI